jgi:arylsulfatase A-like enzyme
VTTARLTRRSLIAVSSAAAAAPLLGSSVAAEATPEATPEAASAPLHGMNVLLFMTDQQRHIQHFPEGWEEANLPGLQRLKANGVSFEQATCNTCMCSPSRATMMSGLFPAQHGVKYCLEANMPAPKYPQVELSTDLPNIGTVMAKAGYSTPYKGKWHCSKPANTNTAPAQSPPCTPDEGWVPEDVNKYGFERWNPQDAGANQFICQAGGGVVDNDKRFMTDDGDADAGEEGALPYLRSVAAQQQPFFLTVSLVNPHDVLAYPAGFTQFGYDTSWLASTGIELPATVDEDLSTKPSAQRQLQKISAPLRPQGAEQQQNYLNYYGNLMKANDDYLVQVLDTLEEQGLLENTLVIFTSDHGEMGMTHGGMIQKNFNAYEETLRVPLVYSSPKLFSGKVQSDALVSHVDFVPTMASLFGSPERNANWQGVDYSTLVMEPSSSGVQDYQVFTYDDWQAAQAQGPYVTGANHIVAVRDDRYTLARYYAPDGSAPDEWEMYDRQADPDQKANLAWTGVTRDADQEAAYQRLLTLLKEVEQTRLQPLA